eukprot:COSAG01_NODE_15351_length_1347_cov_1.386218_2_plen_159_part_00
MCGGKGWCCERQRGGRGGRKEVDRTHQVTSTYHCTHKSHHSLSLAKATPSVMTTGCCLGANWPLAVRTTTVLRTALATPLPEEEATGGMQIFLKHKFCDTPRARKNNAQPQIVPMLHCPGTATCRMHPMYSHNWNDVVVHNGHSHTLAPQLLPYMGCK